MRSSSTKSRRRAGQEQRGAARRDSSRTGAMGSPGAGQSEVPSARQPTIASQTARSVARRSRHVPGSPARATEVAPATIVPGLGASIRSVTSQTLDAEPACPDTDLPAAGHGSTRPPAGRAPLHRRHPARDVGRPCRPQPWATPFSGWAFQRAWWDAYGANAHEETLVVLPAGAAPDADPVAIVPLMHRHEVEPGDALTHTRCATAPRSS